MPKYPDGVRRMWASNITALGTYAPPARESVATAADFRYQAQICKGCYVLDPASIDRRAANITNPMVECGFVVGPGRALRAGDNESGVSTPLEDLARGVEIKRRDLYVCATGVRASVKTVNFRYNGTGTSLENLRIDKIADKVYPDAKSKLLWAVEASGDQRMTFDPLWGMVNDSYEHTEGFHTMRSEKLWLPASVSTIISWGNSFSSGDTISASLAAAMSVGLLYRQNLDLDESIYTGRTSFPLIERFGKLSASQKTVSQIPSLIIADSLVRLLVGTKTAIRTAPVEFPAMLSINDLDAGLSRASVVPYRRAIRYDPNESVSNWAKTDGNLLLDFGRFGNRDADYFVQIIEDDRRLLLEHQQMRWGGHETNIGYDEFQQNPGYDMGPYRDVRKVRSPAAQSYKC